MIQSLILIQNQYASQRKVAVTPFSKKQVNKVNDLNPLDDHSPVLQTKQQKFNDGVSGNNARIFIQKFSREIQQKPKIKVIFFSYVICAFFNLYNAQNISKFRKGIPSGEGNEGMLDQTDEVYENVSDETINTIIFQFLAQDYFIYTAVRLLFHDNFLRKIEIKDLIVSFWMFYICCSASLIFVLILIPSIWQNMLIFTAFNTYLIYRYRAEQNSIQNLFQIRSNLEQVLRISRRRAQVEGEANQEVQPNQEGQELQGDGNQIGNNMPNGNNSNNINPAANGYDSDELENEEQEDTVRLIQRRNHSSTRTNPIVTELVQQFIGEHYERNQVIQLIQIGMTKWLVIYKVSQVKYAGVFINSGKTKILTQKIDPNYIVLHYYWDSLPQKQSTFNNDNNNNNNNNNNKKNFINLGLMFNTYTGKLSLFTVNAQGLKYLSTLDMGVVNREQIILHQQYPKFVTMRLKDIVFRDLLKNEMSSQTLVNYSNRRLQLYYAIDDTDYVISVEEETLIVSSILSTVEWKANSIGNDWEIELMSSIPSSHLSAAQSSLIRNHSYYDKKQYFIQEKTKTYDFPTNIKNINILNRRHLFVQDENCFYVYSIPTQQILRTLANKYVDGFQIIPIERTINSPNLSLDQFLEIQNYIQKMIAQALAKSQNISKPGITTENPALIYLSQYKSIPITYYSFNSNNALQQQLISFIYPKEIQASNVSTLQTDNIFQIQQVSLATILQQVSQ